MERFSFLKRGFPIGGVNYQGKEGHDEEVPDGFYPVKFHYEGDRLEVVFMKDHTEEV